MSAATTIAHPTTTVDGRRAPALRFQDYSSSRASYDLTRLRRNGLITRVPDRNLYQLTDDGLAFAIFYTTVHNRVLRPRLASPAPPTPAPLRAALRTIDDHIDARLADARLPSAAA